MKRYKHNDGTVGTFIQSCRNWDDFVHARKTWVATGLTVEEARKACALYNDNRTPRQIKRKTKMGFDSIY